MSEQWKISPNKDSILVDKDDHEMVAVIYGYGGAVDQNAPGVAERATLIVNAPSLLARAEAAEAEREKLMQQNRIYGALSVEAAQKITELQAERDEAQQKGITLAKWLATATKERDAWMNRARDAEADRSRLALSESELRRQLEQAKAELAEYKRAHEYAWKNALDDALNSGDGVYRP